MKTFSFAVMLGLCVSVFASDEDTTEPQPLSFPKPGPIRV